MPRQLIYTSAPRGLVPGQSGYCTVARSRDLREALIPRLEKLSYYTPEAGDNPVICAYRILEVRGDRYHVLTRIVAAGLDFTRRSRFLAHHLIFDAAENISPAQLFLEWQGWQNNWEGEPRWIEDSEQPHLPIGNQPVRNLVLPPGGLWVSGPVDDRFVLLQSLAQTGVVVPFTNCFQPGDDPTDFLLRAVWPRTASYEAAARNRADLMNIHQMAGSLAIARGMFSASLQIDPETPRETTKMEAKSTFFTKEALPLLVVCAVILGFVAFRIFDIPKISTELPADQTSPPLSSPVETPKPIGGLENILPGIPTWLVSLPVNRAVASASLPALDRIFKQLQEAEIFSKDILARIQPNLGRPPEQAKLDARVDSKFLRCLAENGSEVVLHFNGMVESHSSVPLAVEVAGARLLIIPAAAPISLSPRWLVVEEGREAVSLAVDLENRLRQITLPAGAELALRPTVDPFAGAQKEFSIQPSTSLELLAVRADVANIVGEKEKKIEAMKTENAELLAADKRVIAAESDSDKLRKKRLADLSLAMPKAVAELKSLREKEALIPETLRGISAFSLFLCQSNVNSEIIRFTEGAAP